MSFQGDVAGIGMGELLQGLARGGQDGVLTLRGHEVSARVGISTGQMFLLPEHDEDPEIWRRRCERAWAGEPEQRIDHLRMSEIAFAVRLETMFQLLDSQGVHFRFEPGEVPGRQALLDDAPQQSLVLVREKGETKPVAVRPPVFCPGISIEYLLLEYARLSDEVASSRDQLSLSVHDVPLSFTSDAPAKSVERLWKEIDGISSATEIADRLGWPLRQALATLADLCIKGHLRLADTRELLVLARLEIENNRFARAGSRLCGWIQQSPPGPSDTEDAKLLLDEWRQGKLPVVLASMEARPARLLLKRIETHDSDAKRCVQRWVELRKYHRHDAHSELALVQWQLRSTDEADQPELVDLLRLARRFQERGQNLRAGTLLRACTRRLPETTAARLEVGMRLIEVGAAKEGAHWVLEACRGMLAGESPEKALAPLRAVLQVDPGNREARGLLGNARLKAMSGKRSRRNSVVVLAALAVLALAAAVKVHSVGVVERRLRVVKENLENPAVALRLLEEEFGEDDSPGVAEMRRMIETRLRAEEDVACEGWLEKFRACEAELVNGDPRLGLERTLGLEPPPTTILRLQTLPDRLDLLSALAARLEQSAAEADETATREGEATLEVLHAEQRLLSLVAELVKACEARKDEAWIDSFLTRVGELRVALQGRNDRRAEERAARIKAETMERQEQLLRAARAHADAGDLERAVRDYRELLELSKGTVLATLLEKQAAPVFEHHQAYLDARELAAEGRHDEARETLDARCDNLGEHLLPWDVITLPAGARARFADGTSRVTPFTLESAFGEVVEFELELAGHVSLPVERSDPLDLELRLSRTPERWWQTQGHVDAPPVAVDEHHIVANRAGEVGRLLPDGTLRWRVVLDGPGGIARAPVLAPRRLGSLLVVTEDGTCWFLDAADGRIEGPWQMHSAPVAGPLASSAGVSARFRDGSVAVWESRLNPTHTPADQLGPEADALKPDSGSTAGMSVLRRSSLGTSLRAPWAPLEAAVEDGVVVVRREGEGEGEAHSFAVRLEGEWSFLAWEPPSAKIPRGRLWVSDESGLRSFLP